MINPDGHFQKSKKNKNKKNSDEDEIIVASEDVTGSGNDFPTLPVSKQFNNADDAPYFMATSDHNVNQNNFNATLASNPGTGTARSYGKHTIPRPNIQQNTTHSTRKQDPNHLIFRREGEKEEDTDTTGTGDEKEVMKLFLHIGSCYNK